MTRKPLSQGDEDGFCGLYAIINALTLLFPSRMDEERRSDVFKVIAKACKGKWPGMILERNKCQRYPVDARRRAQIPR